MIPSDPRAEFVPAPPGRARVLRPKSVTVIGGGIAGLAAATILAERGVTVTLLEACQRLGGRVSAWPLEDGRTMSRGFHAFFRQYYNLRDLLSRTAPELSRLRPIADYPLTRRSGATDSFAGIPRTPPFNLAGFVLTSPTFPLTALGEIDVTSACELIDVDFPASFHRYDGESAAAFLDRLRFPTEARHLALEVFARSFFADPEDFSAGELVAMFHTYFAGSAEGLLFDVPDDDYDTALWAPLGQYLRGLGVRIVTGCRATALRPDGNGWTVRAEDGDELVSDAVVLAADPASARALIATAEAAAGISADAESASAASRSAWFSRVAAERNAPAFAVLRLWFAKAVDPTRPAFLGTSGFALLDNVSVLDRFEAGAADWAREHGGSVVELHAYALSADDTEDEHRLGERLLADLHEIYPETAHLPILAQELLIDDDCGLVDIRPWGERPGVVTPLPGLVLAGDWVRCETPVALMERATTTGYLAANHLLAGWRTAGTDIWSPPTKGLLRRGLLGKLRATPPAPRPATPQANPPQPHRTDHRDGAPPRRATAPVTGLAAHTPTPTEVTGR